MAFAIKTEVRNARAKAFAFVAQKTMYGGKHIARGDTVFVFASEKRTRAGPDRARVVTSAEAVATKRGIARQATNKIAGISAEAAAFLDGFF